MKYDVYCDESHPDVFASTHSSAHRLVLGSIWLERTNRSTFKDQLHELRNCHMVGGEFKWQKISPSREEFYIALVEWFFAQQDNLRFRCIIVNSKQIDLARYHQNDQELGFYKFYYQLLRHWVLEFNEYSIFLDYKSNRRRERLPDLQKCLSNSCMISSIDVVQSIRSTESVFIQLADVLTGAVSEVFNNTYVSSQSKRRVRDAIAAHTGGRIHCTERSEEKFNVFCISPRGGW